MKLCSISAIKYLMLLLHSKSNFKMGSYVKISYLYQYREVLDDKGKCCREDPATDTAESCFSKYLGTLQDASTAASQFSVLRGPQELTRMKETGIRSS